MKSIKITCGHKIGARKLQNFSAVGGATGINGQTTDRKIPWKDRVSKFIRGVANGSSHHLVSTDLGKFPSRIFLPIARPAPNRPQKRLRRPMATVQQVCR